MTLRLVLLPFLVLLRGITAHLIAADAPQQGWNPGTTFAPLSPEEAIKTIEVPKGYHLQCVASDTKSLRFLEY